MIALAIIGINFFVYIPIRTIPDKFSPSCEEYFKNGLPWGDEVTPTTDDEIDLIKKFIQGPYAYEHIPTNTDDMSDIDDEEKASIIAQDEELKSRTHEQWAARFKDGPLLFGEAVDRDYQYGESFKNFMLSVAYRQTILQRVGQKKTTDNFKELFGYFQSLEERRLKYAQWLTDARNSKEEYYLISKRIRASFSLEPIDYRPEDRSEFWKPTIQMFAFNLIEAVYPFTPDTFSITGAEIVVQKNNKKISALAALNATSMAIIRHQVCNDCEGVEYSKTTEYTGSPICVVKLPGGLRKAWSFDSFMKTLELAEAEAGINDKNSGL